MLGVNLFLAKLDEQAHAQRIVITNYQNAQVSELQRRAIIKGDWHRQDHLYVMRMKEEEQKLQRIVFTKSFITTWVDPILAHLRRNPGHFVIVDPYALGVTPAELYELPHQALEFPSPAERMRTFFDCLETTLPYKIDLTPGKESIGAAAYNEVPKDDYRIPNDIDWTKVDMTTFYTIPHPLDVVKRHKLQPWTPHTSNIRALHYPVVTLRLNAMVAAAAAAQTAVAASAAAPGRA